MHMVLISLVGIANGGFIREDLGYGIWSVSI